MKEILTTKRRWIIGFVCGIILSIFFHFSDNDNRTLIENWKGRLLVFVVPTVCIPFIIKPSSRKSV